ncbi:MAG: hydrogenase maturation nickel metallochaperone HypA [Verrucomicrobiae bacterium]|nr:hydrogenase maturation nickel metallochaperone HypA [Verrucomicrobiae bacterium]
MSIAEALVEAVQKECAAHREARVVAVHVRVGALRLVVAEVLKSCYDAAARDTSLSGSRLEVETVEARARCPQCSHEFVIEDRWFECPQCQAAGGELLSGQELELTAIALEEKQSTTTT